MIKMRIGVAGWVSCVYYEPGCFDREARACERRRYPCNRNGPPVLPGT